MLGHKWEELFPCIQWMTSFSAVISDLGNPVLKTFDQARKLKRIQSLNMNITLSRFAAVSSLHYTAHHIPADFSVW